MQKEKIIEVSDLYASFDGREILSSVSFSAYKGEVTVILGGSGSGKTTVLKHLLGLYPIAGGTVRVLGKDIAKLREVELRDLYLQMGVFYQSGALLNSLTVAENVALPLAQHTKLPEDLICEIVMMKLGLVNLSHAYHLYPSQLSGGMLKRAALARSIAMDPPLLFCDEPGAGLDPISLESLDNLILNLKNKLGMSIVMVTHEVTSIMRVANRIVFLDQGKVAFQGSPQEALKSKVPAVYEFFSVFSQSSGMPDAQAQGRGFPVSGS
ncbi:MAG: ATP-binding cassette domain-containing protein [Bacteroidales bacterium]|nr:ATP-binding cassette domain-containing protein [Bacteroidales bacterium]